MSRDEYDPHRDAADATWALVEILGETFKNIAPRPDDSRVSVVDAIYYLADALRSHAAALRELAKKERS